MIRTVLALALCIVALVLVVVLDGPEAESPAVTPSFAGSARCGECHEEEYGAWRGSHHDLAMQYATEETVLGDFDDAVFEHGGVTYRFTRNDGSYEVHVDGERYPAPFTFGVEPLQQVLLDVGKGRFQALPVAWDVANERWYAWYEEPFDLHEPRFTWNHMCAACHSTDFRKNWDESAQAYASTFEEIDVACESCHGPGRQHADDPERPIGTLDCAHCHSRRAQLHDNTFGDFPGAHAPALITEPLYYSDGQIRDEVYVWGSFQQSKMHGVGVTCLDCHDPHSARLLREGNAVCTECHRLDPPERFPTLKKRDYETYAHHNHDPGSVRCVECHMPARVYMGIDERRDHSFRVPRPDLAASIGVPNACNACHLDRPPEWAAEAMLGMGDGTAAQRPHFGTAFASGDVAGLVRVAFDEAQPEIVRASAIVRLAGRGEPEAREAVEEAAASRLPLMRLAAVRAGARDLDPLLQDEAEAVALEAAARLGVLNEPLRRHLDYLADVAEGPYNLALVQERRGKPEEAVKAYRRALERDAGFIPARFNLGMLLARLGRPGEAEEQFEAVLEQDPDNAEAHYSLGLLLAEAGRHADAVPHLRKATRPRALYNLGLALQRLGRHDDARAALEAARKRLPGDNDVVYALAVLHAQRGETNEAKRYAAILDDRGDPRAAAFR